MSISEKGVGKAAVECEKKRQALKSHVGKVGDGGYLYFFYTE